MYFSALSKGRGVIFWTRPFPYVLDGPTMIPNVHHRLGPKIDFKLDFNFDLRFYININININCIFNNDFSFDIVLIFILIMISACWSLITISVFGILQSCVWFSLSPFLSTRAFAFEKLLCSVHVCVRVNNFTYQHLDLVRLQTQSQRLTLTHY